MSSIAATGLRVRRVAATTGWAALALFLAVFAVFEAVKYGIPTTAAAVAFAALPLLAPRVRLVQSPWIPLVVLVGYSVPPLEWPPLFTAGLGWMTVLVIRKAVRRG
jgi:hypothetical protein